MLLAKHSKTKRKAGQVDGWGLIFSDSRSLKKEMFGFRPK